MFLKTETPPVKSISPPARKGPIVEWTQIDRHFSTRIVRFGLRRGDIPPGDHWGPQHHANRNAKGRGKATPTCVQSKGPHGPGANVTAWRMIKAMRLSTPNTESGHDASSPQAARRVLTMLITSYDTTWIEVQYSAPTCADVIDGCFGRRREVPSTKASTQPS